ncbi:MAG TPA: histidinol dehydrogenase, partial [Nitrospirota bacterium]|nr:histidinol dehydrogenase [Nitrospirota bacterium]
MRTLKSGQKGFESFFKKIENRAGEVPASVERQVREIIRAVQKEGDAALFAYTKKFDGAAISAKSVRVGEAEIEKAYAVLPEEDIDALRLAGRRIADFHERQRQQSWFVQEESGATLGQR